MNGKEFNNLISIMEDFLVHPDGDDAYLQNLARRAELNEAEISDLYKAFRGLKNNPGFTDKKKEQIVTAQWRLTYKTKPPTPEEFVTEKWIGPVANSIYDYVKKDFINFFKEESPYRDAIFYSCIGYGKSFLSTLIALYVAVHLFLMKDPKKNFNLNPATVLAILFVSFSIEKVTELIVEPFTNIISSSPKFRRARSLEQMEKWQKEEGTNRIVWTTAGSTNVMTMGPNVNFKVASDPAKLLGLTIVLGVLTELTFFRDRGFGDDFIMRLYNDMKGRVRSRMAGHYWGRTILDSSPNDMDSALDKYIVKESPKDPKVMLIRSTKWGCQPWQFQNPKITFPVFIGTSSLQPKIITPDELSDYEKDEILDVPEELRQLFVDDLSKSLKDFGGIPAGGDDKLIKNKDRIEEIFEDSLLNIYDYIQAPASESPEGLIWQSIKDTFFIKHSGKHQFYRNPSAPRFISVDQSISGDLTGISMVHLEMSKGGELMFITDFNIGILAGKDRINLEAIKYFIHDLRKEGNINISAVSFDRFQSESTVQYLKRHDFQVEYLSVDTTTEPYLSYISYMNNGRIKAGKNIILKNNLKSLIMSETPKSKKKKVDHLQGQPPYDKANGDWDSGNMGFWAKDISDSHVASVELANKYGPKVTSHIWNPELLTDTAKGLSTSLKDNFGLSILS